MITKGAGDGGWRGCQSIYAYCLGVLKTPIHIKFLAKKIHIFKKAF